MIHSVLQQVEKPHVRKTVLSAENMLSFGILDL